MTTCPDCGRPLRRVLRSEADTTGWWSGYVMACTPCDRAAAQFYDRFTIGGCVLIAAGVVWVIAGWLLR